MYKDEYLGDLFLYRLDSMMYAKIRKTLEWRVTTHLGDRLRRTINMHSLNEEIWYE